MAKDKNHITESEMNVLHVLWERGASTIREIVSECYGEVKTSLYGGVQSLLDRLETKGYVKRNRSSVPHLFTATRDQSTVVGQQLQHVADTLCGGSMTPLLSCLVENVNLNDDELQTLRKMIADFETNTKRPQQ